LTDPTDRGSESDHDLTSERNMVEKFRVVAFCACLLPSCAAFAGDPPAALSGHG
jgi:hypothetical protein